jgi:hypothetical protein
VSCLILTPIRRVDESTTAGQRGRRLHLKGKLHGRCGRYECPLQRTSAFSCSAGTVLSACDPLGASGFFKGALVDLRVPRCHTVFVGTKQTDSASKFDFLLCAFGDLEVDTDSACKTSAIYGSGPQSMYCISRSAALEIMACVRDLGCFSSVHHSPHGRSAMASFKYNRARTCVQALPI